MYKTKNNRALRRVLPAASYFSYLAFAKTTIIKEDKRFSKFKKA